MESLGLVEFREGSLIFVDACPDYDAAFGILYKRHTKWWYVFWSDTGCNHNAHEGVSRKSCETNFRDKVWKLIAY